MLNIKELDLHLVVDCNKGFIDGNDLKKNIINHMLRLNKFTFKIRSAICLRYETNLLSNEDIQHTFRAFKDNQITSCVDYFPEIGNGECYIYSHPYKLKFYKNITNTFPGELFECVREISLFDEQPFEHEFFIRIEKSFPLLEKLIIINTKPQNDKRRKKEKNNIILVSNRSFYRIHKMKCNFNSLTKSTFCWT
jgi:hypothetical protein